MTITSQVFNLVRQAWDKSKWADIVMWIIVTPIGLAILPLVGPIVLMIWALERFERKFF